jgi:hypothetical protein
MGATSAHFKPASTNPMTRNHMGDDCQRANGSRTVGAVPVI